MAYFQPNCTLPPDGVNYVGSPNIRTTLDILWSSLATIIACTYSVLHLNVPEQRRGKDPGWQGDMKWALRRFGTKLKWCILNIFMPEFIFAKGVADWWNARKQLKQLQRKCPDISQRITLTHMLFADMGGFALAYRTGDAAPVGTKYWHLDTHILVDLIVNKNISLEPAPVEEIIDRSKSDLLTKTITLLQICYFVLAVLVRVGHGQAICELELGTVAFVACSAVTYMVTFQKPKSPETPIVLPGLASAETMRQVREYVKSSTARGFLTESGYQNIGSPPRNDLMMGSDAQDYVLYASLSTAVLFSSIHVAGWNLSFASVADMWLWRASALTTTGAPVIFLGLSWLSGLDPVWFYSDCWWFNLAIYVPIISYLVGRLILIVEMFRGLVYLPPDAYTTTWTANIPHIG